MNHKISTVVLIAALPHLAGCGLPDELPNNRRFGSILNNDTSNIMYAGTGENMMPKECRKGDRDKAMQMQTHSLLSDHSTLEVYRKSPMLLPQATSKD